jgi:transposase
MRHRVEVRTGVERRRRWTSEEKGRIVGEAVARGAVIAVVARRHDLTPQHLSNWIRAAKQGRFALPADDETAFVPVVTSVPSRVDAAATGIEIVVVRVAAGTDAATLEAVLRAVKRT